MDQALIDITLMDWGMDDDSKLAVWFIDYLVEVWVLGEVI